MPSCNRGCLRRHLLSAMACSWICISQQQPYSAEGEIRYDNGVHFQTCWDGYGHIATRFSSDDGSGGRQNTRGNESGHFGLVRYFLNEEQSGMERKTIGAVLGAVGLFLWFEPFVYVKMMDMDAFKSGQHIGGIAYLLLAASLAYSVFSWKEAHAPRMIAAGLALVICLLFALQAGSNIAWGLIALLIIFSGGFFMAFRDNKREKTWKIQKRFFWSTGFRKPLWL